MFPQQHAADFFRQGDKRRSQTMLVCGLEAGKQISSMKKMIHLA